MKISVLMPAYKAKYLAEAISSVLAQTYKDFELIIVNDKSPENLTSIVEQFEDSRIRYFINEENLGHDDIVANWNKCLSYAEGEFFCLLCDDDLYEPTFIDEMLRLSEKYPKTNVFRSGVKQLRGEVFETYYPSSPEWESCEEYMWHAFNHYRKQTISEWFFRRMPVVKQGGYCSLPLAWYSDYLSVFVFSLDGGIASTTKHLVHFRMSGENITSMENSNSQKKMDASKFFEEKVIELIDDSFFTDPDIIKSALKSYLHGNRIFNMATCNLSVFLFYLDNRKTYQLTGKMFAKALLLRFVRFLNKGKLAM